MKYVLGIDAGGTKTQCVIAAENGTVLGEGFGAEANHQTCGIEKAAESLRTAMNAALVQAGLKLQDISYGVFGMAGADGPDDFAILNPAVADLMDGIGFEVVHDGWIGFRSADVGTMGVVSICGTGAAHSGQNSAGEKLVLRNLDYIIGNLGGGHDIMNKALHYAFRSNEGTWEKSMLEEALPAVFDVSDMDQVCEILKYGRMTKEQEFRLPILTFDLARKGDSVCRMIIENLGAEEGRYAAAIVRRLHMEEDKVPAVLIGSLFKTGEPILIDAYMNELRKAAPNAYPVIPNAAPVHGAVLLALDYLHTQQ